MSWDFRFLIFIRFFRIFFFFFLAARVIPKRRSPSGILNIPLSPRSECPTAAQGFPRSEEAASREGIVAVAPTWSSAGKTPKEERERNNSGENRSLTVGRMRSYFFIDVGEILCRQIGRGDLWLNETDGRLCP